MSLQPVRAHSRSDRCKPVNCGAPVPGGRIPAHPQPPRCGLEISCGPWRSFVRLRGVYDQGLILQRWLISTSSGLGEIVRANNVMSTKHRGQFGSAPAYCAGRQLRLCSACLLVRRASRSRRAAQSRSWPSLTPPLSVLASPASAHRSKATTGPVATPLGRQGLRLSISASRAIAKASTETVTVSPASPTTAVHGGGDGAIGATDVRPVPTPAARRA